jgi:hypothetical protein
VRSPIALHANPQYHWALLSSGALLRWPHVCLPLALFMANFHKPAALPNFSRRSVAKTLRRRPCRILLEQPLFWAVFAISPPLRAADGFCPREAACLRRCPALRLLLWPLQRAAALNHFCALSAKKNSPANMAGLNNFYLL